MVSYPIKLDRTQPWFCPECGGSMIALERIVGMYNTVACMDCGKEFLIDEKKWTIQPNPPPNMPTIQEDWGEKFREDPVGSLVKLFTDPNTAKTMRGGDTYHVNVKFSYFDIGFSCGTVEEAVAKSDEILNKVKEAREKQKDAELSGNTPD